MVEKIPNVAVKFGHEFVSFTEQAGGVTAQSKRQMARRLRSARSMWSAAMAGRARSRKQLGFKMEGEPNIWRCARRCSHCPELYDKVRGRAPGIYHRIDDHWTLMIVQDSRGAFHHSCRRRQG